MWIYFGSKSILIQILNEKAERNTEADISNMITIERKRLSRELFCITNKLQAELSGQILETCLI